MIIDDNALENAIDSIAESENLNSSYEEGDNYLEREFTSGRSAQQYNLKQKSDLLKPWESNHFKMLLQSYIKKKYNKEKLEIPNTFAEKVYVKAYNEHIASAQNSSRFSPVMKVLYHPYISLNDFNFVNAGIIRGQQLQLYSSIGVVTLTAFGLYTTEFGKKVRGSQKLFVGLVGLPPILTIIGMHFIGQYSLNHKIEKLGLLQKYGIV